MANSLKVKANGQAFNLPKSILPGETVEAEINYKVDEAVSDVTIEVTTVYAKGDGDKATVKAELSKPDLSIKSVVLSGTGDRGKRIFDVNLGDEGMSYEVEKKIAETNRQEYISSEGKEL